MARRTGQIVPRGESRWLVRVFLGRDANGKRRYHNRTIHGGKKDAQRYLTKVQRDLDLGEFTEPSEQPLSLYLADWLLGPAANRVTSKTLADYTGLLNRHIIPVLGDQKLCQLSAPSIQRVYNGMIRAGLSPRTVRYAHAVLRSALAYGVETGLLTTNPATLVDLPKAVQREMRAFTPDQASLFLQAVQSDRWFALWETLLMTGVRPGEALALKWSDVKDTTLTIQRSLVRHSDGTWEFKDTKTGRARRVTIPTSTSESLQRHRRAQLEERLRSGGDYHDHHLIFASRNGNPLDWQVTVRRHFNRIIAEAGLPQIRPYDLRHTNATLLLEAGVNVKVVSERLGHASSVLTLDTYSHVSSDMQQGAVERFEAHLRGG